MEFIEWLLDDHLYDYLGAYMFLALALTLFTGLPVAFALGSISLLFGLVGIYLEIIDFAVFFQIINRVWGGDGGSGAIQNPILVAIPCFVFMGTMLERSQVAADLLHILQVMLKRVPGGLALSITAMGTIMAATTGIIGAVLPGLLLSGLYFAYVVTRATINPSCAPPLPDELIQVDPTRKANVIKFFAMVGGILIAMYLLEQLGLEQINWSLLAFLTIFVVSMWMGRREGNTLFGGILKGFVPPIFLIMMVLGSIFAGWATPTEAAGIGAFGSMVLAWFNRTLSWQVMREVCHRTGLTTAMIFFIFVGATAFSTVFRNVYGEDLIIHFIEWLELGAWPLLFLLLFTVFIMGFFFDFLEITLIILPVSSPVIKAFAPEFAGHPGLEGLTPTRSTIR
ncbi:MAG: TRAP transporter large permease subunit [Minwuia sp.]|nr:TRAP transporter large permease subunit [Minwuia sp.]